MSEGARDTSAAVEAFLSVFRRRSLAFSLLRLSLVAAVTNEAVRWSAIASNNLLGTELPVLSIGPLLLGLTILYAARRWSRAFTASRADDALDFHDRLASYVDFSSRRDIPAELLRAQAGEVASSLGKVEVRRLAPVRPLLLAGPVLLLASVSYPHLLKTTPMVPQIFRTAMVADPLIAPGTPPLSPNSETHQFHRPGAPPPSESDDAESAGEGTDQPAPAKTPIPEGDPAKQADPERGRDSGRQKPLIADSTDGGKELISKTVGSELSKVVDPLYSPPGESPAPPPEPSGGTVSFRLLPRAEAGGGARGGDTSGESSPNSVIIDFDGIPERYRSIVRAYFRLLADGSLPLPASGKENL